MDSKTRYRRLQRLSDGDFPALTILYARRYLDDYPEMGPAWVLLGKSLVELARYGEAEQAFNKAIELCPAKKQDIPLAHLGHLFVEAGKYDQAESWYQRSIQANPNDAGGYIYLGAVQAKQGQFEAAEATHRKAIACPEGCIEEAYLNLGFVLRAQERFQETDECFREAIALDPEYDLARQALVDVERCIKWATASQNRHS